jgi:hypothetical protein
MLSVFVDDRLFFIDAKSAIARVCRMLSFTPDQLSELHGLGERQTAVRGDPLLLPGHTNGSDRSG